MRPGNIRENPARPERGRCPATSDKSRAGGRPARTLDPGTILVPDPGRRYSLALLATLCPGVKDA